MPRADLLHRLLAAVLLVAVAGCSETTFRRSTQHHVVVDGREITVSWIRLQLDEVEVVAWEPDTFQWTQAPARPRLDRVTAARAADEVADQVCWRGRLAVDRTPATWSDDHHAFRYRCLP